MRKKYVFWWALSAVLFYMGISWAINFGPRNLGILVWSGVCIYIGYRRWVEYHETQDDRRMMREYLAAKTEEAQKNTANVEDIDRD